MGNIPICNCIVNLSKDIKKGNFYLDDLENENEKLMNYNETNNNNVINSDTSKEIPQKKNVENKIKSIQKISKDNNNSSFVALKTDISPSNTNNLNKNKVNKDNEIKSKKNSTLENSTNNTLDRKQKENKKIEEKSEEKEIKQNKEIKKEEKEIKLNQEIKIEEKEKKKKKKRKKKKEKK